jgi:hypothetical protein
MIFDETERSARLKITESFFVVSPQEQKCASQRIFAGLLAVSHKKKKFFVCFKC